VVLTLGLVPGGAAPATPWVHSEGAGGQIVVESFDSGWGDAHRDVAVQIREKLSTPLGLVENRKSRTHLLIRVEPLKTGISPVSPIPRLGARRTDEGVDLQVSVRVQPGGEPVIDENFQRVFILALVLERALQVVPLEVRVGQLPAIPLWLVEGLNQVILEDNHPQWTLLVRRAVFNQRTPELSEVLSWNELSSDKLQRAWQQAFCYYTWRAAGAIPERREKFLNWLDSLVRTDPAKVVPFWSADRDHTLWKEALEETSTRESETIYSWDETSAQFARLQTLVVPSSTQEDVRLVPIDQLASWVEKPVLAPALHLKVRELLSLELRAHFLWRPVLAEYRTALIEIFPAIQTNTGPTPTPRPGGRFLSSQGTNRSKLALEAYQNGMARARNSLQGLLQSRGKISDYLDWFEVTRPTSTRLNPFLDYLKLHEELESVELRKNDPFKSEMLRVEASP
jgi:hypothetical protein